MSYDKLPPGFPVDFAEGELVITTGHTLTPQMKKLFDRMKAAMDRITNPPMVHDSAMEAGFEEELE